MQGLLEALEVKQFAVYRAQAELINHKAVIHNYVVLKHPQMWLLYATVDGRHKKLAGLFLTKDEAVKEYEAWKGSKWFEMTEPEFVCVDTSTIPYEDIIKWYQE